MKLTALFILAALLFIAAFFVIGFNINVGEWLYMAAMGIAIVAGILRAKQLI